MPRLNLFLNAPVELDHEAISFNDSLLGPVPKLGTETQRQALHCILSNVGRYGRQPLFFHIRNQANPPPQYNPHGYGQKPLIAVIEQLRDNGLLQLQRGTSWGPDYNYPPPPWGSCLGAFTFWGYKRLLRQTLEALDFGG